LPDPLQTTIGTPFTELQSVDSTNNYALDRIHAGLAQHGAAFFSHEQFAGKGQRGKNWMSERGSNINLSVVVDPKPLVTAQLFQLSACVAISFCEFYKRFAGDEDVKIKWPNDLYWQDRKAGGVLIENILGADKTGQTCWLWAVVGLGLNVNQASFPAELRNPVSLLQITGKKFSTVDLAKELCLVLDKNIRVLRENTFDGIYASYLENLYKKNQVVRFKKGSRNFDALVKSVSPTGGLVVQHSIEEEFGTGELEWLV
jgi:BirA family transcriptional regulator, biotin operon repressor / biotin---[acetyl-CoA-carboxylase] ligase